LAVDSQAARSDQRRRVAAARVRANEAFEHVGNPVSVSVSANAHDSPVELKPCDLPAQQFPHDFPTAAADRRELRRQPPAPDARHEKRPSAASGREVLSVQAAAAAEEVERLEAAYQHAFAAIETLVAAIERVHQLRRQQRPREQANKLGVAVKRPEPWHVRTAHDIELRQLNKRFIQAVNSSW
jgi:hypothetical protein